MTNLYKQLRIWILFSWSFLTIGILLGSWWAYHELGWGGWWFWDPVENASLMPWLLATAGIHSIIRKRLKSWAFFCIQSTFIFSILGTFFVRSGLLSSVHSFATDSTRGFYLLIFLLFLISISIFHFFFCHFPLSSNSFLFKFMGRRKKTNYCSTKKEELFEQLFTLQNFYFCAICGVVFCGTAAPLVFQWFWNRETITGASFYNSTLIPLFTSVFFILIYAHYLQFFSHFFGKKENDAETNQISKKNKKTPPRGVYFLIYFFIHLFIGNIIFELNILNSLYIAICFLLISCIILSQYENNTWMSFLCYAPFSSLPNRLTPTAPYFINQNKLQSAKYSKGQKKKRVPVGLGSAGAVGVGLGLRSEMNTAHTGLIFLILGILFSNTYKFEQRSQLNPGPEGAQRLDSQICYLRSIDHSFAPTFHSICANLLISQESRSLKGILTFAPFHNKDIYYEENRFVPILCMFPEKRFYYSNQNIVTTKVSIYSNLFTDFYSIIGTGSIETGWFTTIIKLPFIFCIWLGFIFAVIGGILRLTKLLQKPKLVWF